MQYTPIFTLQTSNMKKILLGFLLIAVQQVFAQNTKQPIVKPSESLYESGLIPIKEGEAFKLSPNLVFATKKNHVVNGTLKAAGAFAVTYKTAQAISGGKTGATTTSATTLLPAIGIGVITALPDFIKSFKQGKTTLSYTFYDAKQQIIATKQIKLTKDSKDITTTKATTNGYIKVTIVSTAKNTNFRNIIIDNATPTEDYSGSIAETMSLANGSDCMGDGDDDGLNGCELKCSVIAGAAKALAEISLNASLLACSMNPFESPTCKADAQATYNQAINTIENEERTCIEKCKH